MKRILIAMILLLAACAPVEQTEPTPEFAPDVREPIPELEEQEPAPPAQRVRDEQIVALSTRVPQLKGYSYTLAPLPQKVGNMIYHVRGDLVRIDLVTPLGMDGWSADKVFLDYDTGYATAYCIDLRGCNKDSRKELVGFDVYGEKRPLDWLEEVQYGEIVGRQQFNERQVYVIRWENDGLYYEALLDDYYGIPQRVSIASDADRTNIVGGQEYQSLETNSVLPEDVEPPY